MTVDLSALPPLRESIAAHGLTARKGLGQHFLLDLNLTRRIVRAAGELAGMQVVEIGPGPGGLTRALVESNADKIIALEKDPRCLQALQPLAELAGHRLQLLEADALQVDPVLISGSPRAVVANLPYNVGTPILINLLRRAREYRIFVLMFQKEVVQRITAPVNSEHYGRLSVIAQYCCRCELAFTVPARAFTPPPKVDSAIVRLTPHDGAPPVPFEQLEKTTALAFGQRRKMLRSIFKSTLSDADFAALAIRPEARAEELSINDFVRLAQRLG